MLELTLEEQRSLQIVCLERNVEQLKKTGSSFNWKKVGLSRAYYKTQRLQVKNMPQPAAAAFQFLQEHDRYYKYFLDQHNGRLESDSILTISSYDLLILLNRIECAMRPHLYPTTNFTDTDIRTNYQTAFSDYTQRVVSIGLFFTRKVLSSVRAYGEDRDLVFCMRIH